MSASAKRPRQVIDLTESNDEVIDLTKSQADSPPMFDSEVSVAEECEVDPRLEWAQPMLAMFDQVGVSDAFLDAVETWCMQVTSYRVSVVGAFMVDICEIMDKAGTLHCEEE